MGVDTKIQWTTHSWSPWHGCAKISPGCANCYAEAGSHRNPAVLGIWGVNGTRSVRAESGWETPLAWDRKAAKLGERHRVFPSLCDPFEDRPELVAPRIRFFETIRRTSNLDWLVLTKRPEFWKKILRDCIDLEKSRDRSMRRHETLEWMIGWLHHGTDGHTLPPNLWLGVSVEDQQRADERIPILTEIPAAVRFVSFEPLLGPIATTPNLHNLYGRIHWAIIGGESSPNARPCGLAWIRSLQDQCRDASVACFVKQLGAKPFETDPNPLHGRSNCAGDYQLARNWLKLRDKKGGDIVEWPEDLRVRKFPR